jgi:hypothetical protein
MLVLAGQFITGLMNLSRTIGYDAAGVIAVTLDPNRVAYRRDHDLQPLRRSVNDLLKANGFADTALTSNVPLDLDAPRYFVQLRAVPQGEAISGAVSSISTGYFGVLGVKILKGRDFTDADERGNTQVTVVSEELAQRLWHSTDVLGRCVLVGRLGTCAEVVGVAGSIRSRRLGDAAAEMFIPLNTPDAALSSGPHNPGRTILVRAVGSSPRSLARLASLVRESVNIDVATVPLWAFTEPQTRPWRMSSRVFTLLGLLGVWLTVFGVYASVSLSLRTHLHGLAVHSALGAPSLTLAKIVMRNGLRSVALGWVFGICIAIIASSLLRSMFFGSPSSDGLIYFVASTVLGATAVVACAGPVWRATTVDPIVAMRSL